MFNNKVKLQQSIFYHYNAFKTRKMWASCTFIEAKSELCEEERERNEIWVQGGAFLHCNSKPIRTYNITQNPKMTTNRIINQKKKVFFHELLLVLYEKNENGIQQRKKRCLPLHDSAKQHHRERKMVPFDHQHQIFSF